jgi:hypothetical protein
MISGTALLAEFDAYLIANINHELFLPRSAAQLITMCSCWKHAEMRHACANGLACESRRADRTFVTLFWLTGWANTEILCIDPKNSRRATWTKR